MRHILRTTTFVCLALAFAHSAAAQLLNDNGFDGDARVSTNFGDGTMLNLVAVQNDGKILRAGPHYSTGNGDWMVIRYTATGGIDTGFGVNGIQTIDFFGSLDQPGAIALQSDGKILLAGTASSPGAGGGFALARLTTTGQLDGTFAGGGKIVNYVASAGQAGFPNACIDILGPRAIAVLPGDAFVVAGQARESGNRLVPAVARYDADGDLDPTFLADTSAGTCPGTDGIRVYKSGVEDLSFNVNGLIAEPDGRMVLAGAWSVEGVFGNAYVYRLETNGINSEAQTLFGNFVNAKIARQPNGRIVITHAGGFTRLLTNLQVDSSFGTGGTVPCCSSEFILDLAVDRHGFIYTYAYVTDTHSEIRRYSSQGVLFDGASVPFQADALALHPDRRVLAAGNLKPGLQATWSNEMMMFIAPVMVRNGDFSLGAALWIPFGAPTQDVIQHNSGAGGVFEFFRDRLSNSPPNQATVFQETGAMLLADESLRAQFDLANSTNTRLRVSVLILEHDFSDLSVCTFWLAPGAASQTYEMRTHTTRAWTNASIYFYAATLGNGSAGGGYRIDNVFMDTDDAVPATRTECDDPTAPAASANPDGPELIVNGNFAASFGFPWETFGNIVHQVTAGVFQFHRPIPAIDPNAGVVLQPTLTALGSSVVMTAAFQLGNSSSVRQRVTVILHDRLFQDLSACTFWLPAGQPLSSYVMRSFTTQPWANATLSLYAASEGTGTHQWIEYDNVSLKTTPSASVTGTECLEPADGGSVLAAGVAAAGMRIDARGDSRGRVGSQESARQRPRGRSALALEIPGGWLYVLDLTVEPELTRVQLPDLAGAAAFVEDEDGVWHRLPFDAVFSDRGTLALDVREAVPRLRRLLIVGR